MLCGVACVRACNPLKGGLHAHTHSHRRTHAQHFCTLKGPFPKRVRRPWRYRRAHLHTAVHTRIKGLLHTKVSAPEARGLWVCEALSRTWGWDGLPGAANFDKTPRNALCGGCANKYLTRCTTCGIIKIGRTEIRPVGSR